MQSNGADSSSTPHRNPLPPPLPAQQQQQPWMAVPYPAAMVMQHQMMPPQPYMAAAYHHHPHHHRSPYNNNNHHHHQQRQNKGSSSSTGENNNNNDNNKTIWIGDLHHWMDESYLHSCFASTGEITSVKVIRNKQTGLSEGYGFVEFFTHATAEKVLQNYAGMLMPHTQQPFHLNWASFSTGEKRSDNTADLSIFVGDLAADVTDSLLLETFSSKYPSVKAAKVVFDVNTGHSKGYGFVRFGDENERTQAMTEMNGVFCSSRPMRTGAATPRKSSGYQKEGGYGSNGTSQGFQSDTDSANTTIFVGGLDPNVTDQELKQPFSQYGEIVSVKIPSGKGCGFVQFANRNNAEEAMQKLTGTVIGKQTVRLSWGRNPANKQQFRPEFGDYWNGAYYQGPVYDTQGYVLPPPYGPSMYTAAYGAYPVYGSNHQQVS